MSAGSSLRVGLLHFTSPPVVGGVEAILGHQAAGLVERGHRPVILAGRGRPFLRDLEYRLLPELDSKYPALLRANATLQRGRVGAEFRALADTLSDQLERVLSGLDVCIVHNALSLHFNLPLTVALHRLADAGRGSPLVAWCHDLSWTNALYLPLMRDEPPWTLLKTPARRTHYVVVSEDRRRDFARLSGLSPDELTVIPAGVDLPSKWALRSRTRQLLDDFGLLAADPLILLPVRITRRKNIEYAIRVVGELRRHGWRPKLLVTGPRGPHDPRSIRYVRELQALVDALELGDEVVLLQTGPSPSGRSWKPTDAMMDELYRAADLMVFPSAQEGFGIPLLEAGAVNLPVFCSDIAPFREIGGEQVELFGLEDAPSAVAARIDRFMREDPRFVLRRRVKTRYDWDAIFDRQLLPLLERAAADGRGTGRRPFARASGQ